LPNILDSSALCSGLVQYCICTVVATKTYKGGFIEEGFIQAVLLYTMTPWKTPRKSMAEWDYRTRINTILIVYETELKGTVSRDF
jgi:hypothetical protein